MRERRDDRAAEKKRESRADERSRGVHRHGPAELLAWERVSQQRVGGGRERGFSGTNAESGYQQVPETARQSASGRSDAPEEYSEKDDERTRAAVRDSRDGNAHDGVEERKREPVHDGELGVAQAEIGPDRLDEQRHDLAIDERHDIRDHQHGDDVPRVGGRAAVTSGGARHHGFGGKSSHVIASICE